MKMHKHIICKTSPSRNRNRGDSIVPTRKRQRENKRCPNRNRKMEGREGKNIGMSTSATQEKRQHARGIRTLQDRKERGGRVAPRPSNTITVSATKESMEAKIKSEGGDTRNKLQTTRRKDKTNDKRGRKANTENDKLLISGSYETANLSHVYYIITTTLFQ